VCVCVSVCVGTRFVIEKKRLKTSYADSGPVRVFSRRRCMQVYITVYKYLSHVQNIHHRVLELPILTIPRAPGRRSRLKSYFFLWGIYRIKIPCVCMFAKSKTFLRTSSLLLFSPTTEHKTI